MNVIFTHHYTTLLGEVIIGDFQNEIIMIDWKYRKMRKTIDQRILKYTQANFVEEKTQLHEECITQLHEYFQKERKQFNLPLHFSGTDFQIKIWQQLLEIPYGKTISYEALTQKVTQPEAIRAVASANGANAISIVVPCHRVIGKNGELSGYAGGLSVKKKLLDIEADRKQLSLFGT